jgi:hypothetical protein
MARRYESFVMLAGMRTGSNFLEANLNALAGVACHGEVFNPHFMGHERRTEQFGISMAARNADPLAVLAAMRRGPDLSGFRFFHDHDPRVLTAVLGDPACAKIILTRNALESYVSLKIAQATGQWKANNAKSMKTAKVQFVEAEFAAHQADQQEFHRIVLRKLQVTGQAAFVLDYADLGELDVLNGLAAFLGVEARLAAVDGTLKKQNPQSLTDKVANPEAMTQAIQRIDWFDLASVPILEPRRGPMVGQLVASAAAPLLYLPIKGVPHALIDWLGAIEKGGVIEGFDQKTLRQWKRQHPGFRSFTVLRHPVVRAYDVFARLLLTERMADMAEAVSRQTKAPLPRLGDTAGVRSAFLAFLQQVKQGLSGQSHLRVLPDWATQFAVLQGFAQAQLPDHILREDRLDDGLRWLADEVGVTTAPDAPNLGLPEGLDLIYDGVVEAAVREAYQRDYVGLGFGPWR